MNFSRNVDNGTQANRGFDVVGDLDHRLDSGVDFMKGLRT